MTDDRCETAAVPRAAEIDIPALKQKYKFERNRRLQGSGDVQYAPSTDRFTQDTYDHDPYSPVVPRDGVTDDVDVVILGAGWSGILAAFHLRQAGISSFKIIDHAGGFGGTWYWNRYPGV